MSVSINVDSVRCGSKVVISDIFEEEEYIATIEKINIDDLEVDFLIKECGTPRSAYLNQIKKVLEF